ncbi:hypothetical protein D3C80_602640 [compost metagenome]
MRSRSLVWMMPIILSISSRQTGIRVCGLARISRTTCSAGASALMVPMDVRCTMTSLTSSSFRSSKPPSWSRSSLISDLSRCSTSTAPRNSSCAESIERPAAKLMPKSRRITRTIQFTRPETGPSTVTTAETGRATLSENRSGLEMAHDLGSTSAKMTRMTVIANVE